MDMNTRSLKVLEFDKIVDRLAAMAVTDMGKEKACSIVPETDLTVINELLKETTDGRDFILKRGNPPLSGSHDIRGSLKRTAMGAILTPGELLKIAEVLNACRNLKNYSEDRETDEEENCVKVLISQLEVNRHIEEKIKNAIISEEEIADNASPALSEIRRKIREFQNLIKDKLNEIVRSSKYQKIIQESIVTMRGDRYVIPVKQEHKNEIPGLVHDMSASGATVFIEPMAVVEANNNIRQLKIKEQLEIERILSELTSDVSGFLSQLETDISILGKLDFIFAKAKLSLDYDCSCPVINQDGYTEIKKGRHPLLDKKRVVPIDFRIGKKFDTLVITGPNTGGKTVTLKTVGLFTLMARAGLHVPAGDGTVISAFEKVFADIGDEQSIEQNLSTFSSHMKNIVNILKVAGKDSLVLFDELGAGTDPTEGAALAIAILEYLRSVGAVTVATTHYSEIKMYAVTTEGVENACCEFDVQTLMPTYKLLIGIPGKSNAFAISQRLGLSERIIDRAREFMTQEDIKFEDMLISMEESRRKIENDKIAVQNYKLEIEKLKKELEEQKNKIALQKDKIIREAKENARRILIDAKREADDIISSLKRLETEREAYETAKAAEELRMKLKKKISSTEESLAVNLMPESSEDITPEKIKPGDSVVILNLDKKGTVLELPDKNGQVLVQVGIMKINVPINNLKIINEKKSEFPEVTVSGGGNIKTKSIPIELDVRGMTVDEAIESIDKYLDNASIAGLNEAFIIHGKGTGALRNGIHQYLRKHPHVKSFRLGNYGEGDTGVTVVEIK